MNTKNRCTVLFVLMVITGFNLGFAQEIGIQLYSLRNQFTGNVPQTLELIKSWGIDIIEGGENTYGVEESKFIQLLKDNELSTASVGSSLEELEQDPQKALARAKAFGAEFVMCPWIPHTNNDFTINEIKHAVAVFNKAGKLFQEQGVTLVYHPHGYEFRPYENGTLFDYMAERAENFDFELDVYWAQHGGENPLALLERYPTKFKLMHLKDMQEGTKGDNTGHSDVETNVVLGTGIIDIKSIVLKARELGVKFMFIEDESSRVVEQVPLSLKFLKSL